jgi:hypothetical protein
MTICWGHRIFDLPFVFIEYNSIEVTKETLYQKDSSHRLPLQHYPSTISRLSSQSGSKFKPGATTKAVYAKTPNGYVKYG